MIGFLLFGGTLSNDLLLQLNKKELKKIEVLKKEADDYEISIFIDSCIEKRIKSGKIIDWNSMPFYVPNKLKRILKSAVCEHEKRYQNVSEFLSELSRIKAELPDWIKDNDSYVLENWKGLDYKITEINNKVVLKKRKHGNVSFRSDKSINGTNFEQVYKKLKKQVRLP